MSVRVNTWISTVQTEPPVTVAEAFAYCERIAREHYENFPVGSLLIPKSRRKHVYSIYAFARTADDFADEDYEDGLDEVGRLAALEDWERKLEASYRGEASHPVFIALAETARELRLPIQPFCDLLSAFKQDVVKRRYANFDEVLDYCRCSANPVGRLILLLFDYRDQHLHKLSDHICTGLQLANFWQDVAVDIRKDRIYLPLNEMEHFGVSIDDLREGRFSERYAALLRLQVERTKEFFECGRALPGMVNGRLAFELRLTWLGGMRILERIEEQGYDTLSARPRITRWDKIILLLKSLMGSKQRAVL
ncbi:MAG: squalene synthase HpnC [Acidobacteria bacterium]|nr:squalene synthase HpnC [Acidobacteriota bacterium]